MEFDPKLRPFEVLAVAIRAEIDASAFYSGLQQRIKNKLLLQKLKFLAFEEENHRKMLERLLGQRFRGVTLEIPEKSWLPPIGASLTDDSTVLDLFKAALAAEIISEEFYREAGRKAEDPAARKILAYLSRVERSHRFVIKSEIDLLSQFPEYYSVEDFHIGHDLVHVGP